MDAESLQIHVIDSGTEDGARLCDALAALPGREIYVSRSSRLDDAIESILKSPPDMAIACIDGLEPQGLGALERLRGGVPDTPVIVVVPDKREILGEESLTKGATDFLLSSELQRLPLERAMRYALERQQIHEALRGLSLLDDPTGFYNTAGFTTLVDYQMKLARRTLKRAFILRCKLTNLDEIRLSHGPREGDTAIKAVAEMLRVTFRSTDILGRLSKDEFICYVNDISGGTAQTVVNRLLHNIDTFNQLCGGLYTFDMRVGIARIYGGDDGAAVEDLIRQAGEAMKAPAEVRLVT